MLTWAAVRTEMPSGASNGIFSLTMFDRDRGVVVGGDYKLPNTSIGTSNYTRDGGRHWKTASTPPRGYRSCVAIRPKAETMTCVAVGPTGSDRSYDGGKTWHPLDDEGFHVIAFSPDGTVAVATGSDGKVGVWHVGR